jgi:hypothetical protein
MCDAPNSHDCYQRYFNERICRKTLRHLNGVD